MTKTLTLDKYLEEKSLENSQMNNLCNIVKQLSKSCLEINSAIQNQKISEQTGNTNGSGEKLMQIEERADNIVKENLQNYVSAIATEDSGLMYANNDTNQNRENNKIANNYLLTSDSIDGSSNIKTLGPLSSIFGILPNLNSQNKITKQNFFQKGENLLLSAIALYSSRMAFIFSLGNNEVKEFLYNPKEREFIFRQDIQIPNDEKYFNVNIGYLANFEEKDRKFLLDYIINEKNMSSRYLGSAGADVRKILGEGGFFAYPKVKSKTSPEFKPKLRVLYENNPFAHLFENAGGLALNERGERILETPINDLDQKGAIYLGNQILKKRFE